MSLDGVRKKIKLAQMERNGEVVRTDTLVKMLVNDKERRSQMADKNAINEMDETASSLDEAKQRVLKAVDGLVHAENDIADRSKKAIARTKDVANQLSDQLNRVNKMLGPDFETRIAQLERVAAALETLSRLDKDGKLQTVMAALSR